MQMQNYLINYATAFTKNSKIKSKHTFFLSSFSLKEKQMCG